MRKEDMTEWLTLAEVMDKMGVSRRTIDRWVESNGFPKPHYFGITRRYEAQAVEDWSQNTPTDSRDVPHNATAARAGLAKARELSSADA